MELDFDNTHSELTKKLQAHLESVIPYDESSGEISKAMRDALIYSGKRFRPILFLFLVKDSGRDYLNINYLQLASAIETIHAASLILDDLPCMDNAKVRRNRPTTHRQYGESVAILSAVGLLSLAFKLITETAFPDDIKSNAVSILAKATGLGGLVQGQYYDLNQNKLALYEYEKISEINQLKTGTLFEVVFSLSSLTDYNKNNNYDQLMLTSKELGQSFQIIDDLRDGFKDSGKDINQDSNKYTLTSLLGSEGVMNKLHSHIDMVDNQLSQLYGEKCLSRQFIIKWFNSSLKSD
ncbi:polyprenyl synthetase family protein [Xenorhabdus sp. KJ12.1]|uniref:polyprenyl synthetase family protein n=1 Tax=Xenorhabdus sp. KJ12.1 TaxID=1851571 RepID=UPI000C04B894|nr:polyprenyl synthetase family protein [Xenorhabdus sp. KJ12.1]PHM67327.1 geranyltranstransferase [Xenorhabdus sp. KJ12.1]